MFRFDNQTVERAKSPSKCAQLQAHLHMATVRRIELAGVSFEPVDIEKAAQEYVKESAC